MKLGKKEVDDFYRSFHAFGKETMHATIRKLKVRPGGAGVDVQTSQPRDKFAITVVTLQAALMAATIQAEKARLAEAGARATEHASS
ncbi:MAG: hypothetical protein INR62_13625 [Rhodospirillales bacterium]|nr:hypothetical protein [Acetobacter sp.]